MQKDCSAARQQWKSKGGKALDTILRGVYGAAGRFLAKRTPSVYIPPAQPEGV